jgi:NADH dehydrogenase
VPGAAEHAFPLYSVADAERLRLHLQGLLQAAVDAAASREPGSIDVVVIGGSPTGVETTGAFAELMLALRKSGRLTVPGQITLVDRGYALLGQFSDKAHGYALEKLTEAGAEVRLGVGVTAVHTDRVQLNDGSSISTRTVVWGGGESGSAVAQAAGPSPGRGGRLDVRPDLTVAGYPGTYAVGDVANIPSGDDAAALPQLGSVAQQSGKWAGQNILRELRGKPTGPFIYKDKGIMAMIGRNAAVAEVGKHHHQVEGPVAFAAWLGIHAMLLSGVHSKIDAFLSWGWDYFDRDHAATVEATAAARLGRPRRGHAAHRAGPAQNALISRGNRLRSGSRPARHALSRLRPGEFWQGPGAGKRSVLNHVRGTYRSQPADIIGPRSSLSGTTRRPRRRSLRTGTSARGGRQRRRG